MVLTPCPMVYSQIPSLTLISDGVLCVLIFKMGKLIFMWPPDSLQCLPQWGHKEPSELSDCNNTDEAINTELLLLLNP